MSNTISPNMNLVVPGVGTEVGPTWALDLNASLSIIDSHNHSAGQGVQIQPNGININADLPFNSNNATLLRSSRFAAQSAVLNLVTDVGCVYVVNNELYYNDVTGGHQIALTNNGSVNAGAGSITGLPSGTASASFAAGTFVWQSATSTAANMDAGSYVFRNATANSKGLTLSPPLAMAADYSVTLPAIPGSQSFMSIDTSGNMAAYASVNQGIQRSNLVSVGQQISPSCGVSVSAGGAITPVTNLSVTITTSGRPVMVFCQSDATNAIGKFTGAGGGSTAWYLFRAGAFFTLATISGSTNFTLFPSSILFLDTPVAGTYTYNVSTSNAGGNTSTTSNMVLVAYEL